MKYLKVTFTITPKHDADSTFRDIILQTAKDVLCEYAGMSGFEAFEYGDNTVDGYVQNRLFDKKATDETIKSFPIEDVDITYSIKEAEDKNWNATWEEEGFRPINIKDRCIIHDTLHPTNNDDSNVLEIIIDTKQAFGTGSHETTFMIASELLDMDIKGKSVLDCGCGTGILSIIASKQGAAKVVGYDIDEWSVENTKHNCTLNGATNVSVLLGDSSVTSQMSETFDVVIANINRNILLADMQAFKHVMKQNAFLILSGFYVEDNVMLIDKAKELGIKFTKQDEKNNWCMLKFENGAVNCR